MLSACLGLGVVLLGSQEPFLPGEGTLSQSCQLGPRPL